MAKKKSKSKCMAKNFNGTRCNNYAVFSQYYCKRHMPPKNKPKPKSNLELIKTIPDIDIKLPKLNPKGLIVKPEDIFVGGKVGYGKTDTLTWMPPSMKSNVKYNQNFNFKDEMMAYPNIAPMVFSFEEFQGKQPQLNIQWLSKNNTIWQIDNLIIEDIEEIRALESGSQISIIGHTNTRPGIKSVLTTGSFILKHPSIIEVERIKKHNLSLMDANTTIKQSAIRFKAKFISAEKVSDWAITKLLAESFHKDSEIERLETKNEELKIIKTKKEGRNLIEIIEKKDNFIRHLMKRLEERGETND